MPIGETRTVLDAILWEKLPLAQDMAAGVPSICADLRDDNIANLFGETRQGGDVSRDNYPEGKSVGREEEIIRYRVISL